MCETKKNIFGSFRDPSGFVFFRDSAIYRQINLIYKENYDYFIGCGLYQALVDARLLIPHTETSMVPENASIAYKVIKPGDIPFISYPYEWCFSQLKHAALTTLAIQKKALEFGMTLKDASAYNIQFVSCRPLLIDTLSFEKYQKGQTWGAYRQFCQHFLAPLALMSYADIRLNQLTLAYTNGIPLDLASSVLPLRTYLRFSLLSHVHCHCWFQKHHENRLAKQHVPRLNRLAFFALIDNLESAIEGLKWQPYKSGWSDYYADTNYSSEAMEFKKRMIKDFLYQTKPSIVFDIAANTGLFSRLAIGDNMQTISFDSDYSVVEHNYLNCVKNKELNILPLVIDITIPSPRIGWANEERAAFFERTKADTILALALIHHLVISNNIPLEQIAYFFQGHCQFLIIEFVPLIDPSVQKLLVSRKSTFHNYTQNDFERVFKQYFDIERSVKLKDSERILYLMERR